MSWAAVAIGGSALLTGIMGSRSASRASDAASQSSQAAIDEQRRQFDTIMGIQRPYSVTGTGALNMLAQTYGLPYAPYQDPQTSNYGGGGANAMSSVGSGGGGGGMFSGSGRAALIGSAAGIDPLTSMSLLPGINRLFGGSNTPAWSWDAGRGVVNVDGRAGGNPLAGGYINPQTGEVVVYRAGTTQRDDAASTLATNYLRTGQGDVSAGPLGRFRGAIDQMRGTGWTYRDPASATANLPAGSTAANGIITPGGPSMSGFFASPDYNFRRTESLRGQERSAAARGGAFSGNAIRANTDLAGNLAAGEFGTWANRLASIAGIGQTAANNTSSAAQNTGTNISSLLQNQGDARASGILGQNNAWTGALNSGLNNWLLNRGGFFNRAGG